MTAPLDPHLVSKQLQRDVDQLRHTVAGLLAYLHEAEQVIAEARAIVRYWDEGLTVVQVAPLAAALEDWDALPEQLRKGNIDTS